MCRLVIKAHAHRELIGVSDESRSRTTHDRQELQPAGDCNPQRDGDSATRPRHRADTNRDDRGRCELRLGEPRHGRGRRSIPSGEDDRERRYEHQEHGHAQRAGAGRHGPLNISKAGHDNVLRVRITDETDRSYLADMSLIERIAGGSGEFLLFALTPPRSSSAGERAQEIADVTLARLRPLDLDGLVLYDIADEAARNPAERPFPFMPTMELKGEPGGLMSPPFG